MLKLKKFQNHNLVSNVFMTNYLFCYSYISVFYFDVKKKIKKLKLPINKCMFKTKKNKPLPFSNSLLIWPG